MAENNEEGCYQLYIKLQHLPRDCEAPLGLKCTNILIGKRQTLTTHGLDLPSLGSSSLDKSCRCHCFDIFRPPSMELGQNTSTAKTRTSRRSKSNYSLTPLLPAPPLTISYHWSMASKWSMMLTN